MSNSNLSAGDNNTLTVTNNNVDQQALTDLVACLRAIAPQLGLEGLDAQDFADDVDALERNGHDLEQGGRRWRGVKRIVLGALTNAAASAAVAQTLELGAAIYP
ncbi:hypothetical protein [Kitasatospora sp. NPDC057500]|uniref:hypothetical protein n=1 Tax=Kitasatospora sp. NPDC057500 TaxID=3346151 RepID=UPI0036B0FA6E